MAKILRIALFSLFFPAVCFAASYEYPLSGGRKAVYEKIDGKMPRKWLVYIPGSGNFLAYSTEPFIKIVDPEGLAGILVINKAGIGLDNNVRQEEFSHSGVREQRLSDIQEIMNNVLPKDAEILLVGSSEGGYLAPLIARTEKRIKAILFLSAGSRNWMEEELMLEKDPVKRQELADFFKTTVIGNMSFEDYYKEYPYAVLNSFSDDAYAKALKKITVPMLFLNGTNDDMVWVDGIRQDVARLDPTLARMIMVPGGDHGLCPDGKCPRAICEQVLKFGKTTFFDSK